MKKIILAGGTGLIGTFTARYLAKRGYRIIILSRSAKEPPECSQIIRWDGETHGEWEACINGAYAVINLAGKSINCVHTERNKQAILHSRIVPTRLLTEACRSCAEPPQVFIQFSSIGYYGNSGDRICNESSKQGRGFLAEVCGLWEDAFRDKPLRHTRTVILRCGLVLSRQGGVLPPLACITRFFAGGAAGNGQQYMSWIHEEDLAGIIEYILDTSPVTGIFNATAPEPATNKEFMKILRRVLHRPYAPAAPAWLIRWVARYIIQTEPSLILEGCRAVPQGLTERGYTFRFAGLKDALSHLCG